MCPDRQILSLYKDQELPSPWKEKLEHHLATCQECRTQLQTYQNLSAFLQSSQQIHDQSVEEIQSRVWRNLSKNMMVVKQEKLRQPRWNREVVLPLPAAIAALLIVAILTGLVAPMIFRHQNPNNAAVSAINTEVPGVIPVSDMRSVLQYLENQTSTADIVIIRLPESSSFVPFGQPELIRAAAYDGRRP